MELTKENVEQWKPLYNAEYERRTSIEQNISDQMTDGELIELFGGYNPNDAVLEELTND